MEILRQSLHRQVISDKSNYLSGWPAGIDLHCAIRRFESLELALEQARLHKMAGSVFQSLSNQGAICLEINENNVAIYLKLNAEQAMTTFSPFSTAARIDFRIAFNHGIRSRSFKGTPLLNFSRLACE
jgi:hypothetical protein